MQSFNCCHLALDRLDVEAFEVEESMIQYVGIFPMSTAGLISRAGLLNPCLEWHQSHDEIPTFSHPIMAVTHKAP